MFYSKLAKFKLRENSKNPSYEWCKENRYTSSFRIPTKDELKNHTNWGIHTGKKNKITVIDLDPYKDGFTFPFNYLELECPIVKSVNGGYHLYFKYDKDIKQTQNDKLQVDIRNDGGYIVCPNTIINGKKYKTIKDCEIPEMPEDIKLWCLDNLYSKSQKSTKGIKTTNKTNTEDTTKYEYNISKEKLEEIFKKLPDKFWNGYSEFLKWTTCCKVLDCKDIWDKINKTKPKYDEENNNRIWDGCKKSFQYNVNAVLEKQAVLIDYFKFKPILPNIRKPHKTINKRKLVEFEDEEMTIVKENILDDKYNYVIKSDTGTGKTTAFKKYIKSTNQQFISIVSRVSLGDEQTEILCKEGLDVRFYQLVDKFEQGQNIVIQVDSLMKLYNIDFSNYVVFLDEFNSIVEYLITSSTLHNVRTIIYQLFTKIINECKQIICTDADISDISMKYLDFTTKKIKFIKNTYLHNNGVKAEEIFNYVDFVKEVKKNDKYMICCDSKDVALMLKKDIGDDKIMCITSETDQYINLDKYDKVIFSPKIIYGLDSSIKRPVFCFYKEHTINPNAFLQQIARCRNITKLWYSFTRKTFKPNDDTLESVKERIVEENTAGCGFFKMVCPEKMNEEYLTLLTMYEYNNTAYATNKFAHFIKLLDERGFNRVNKQYQKSKHNLREILKEFKQYKIDTFDKNHSYIKKLNEILKIPDEEIDNYKELFLSRNDLDCHFRYCKFLNETKQSLQDNLGELTEFNCKKIKTDKMKIYYLYILKEKLGCPEADDITIKNDLSKDDADNMFKLYNIIFRNRKKDDFTTKKSLEKYLSQTYKNLFGTDIITSGKKGKNKIIEYSMNDDKIEYHKTVQKFRDKYDYDFDDANDMFINDDINNPLDDGIELP